jgi:hypothetical protein
VNGLPAIVSPITEISDGTSRDTWPRIPPVLGVAVAREDDGKIAASKPRDLPERDSVEFSIPISPPIGRNQMVIVTC